MAECVGEEIAVPHSNCVVSDAANLFTKKIGLNALKMCAELMDKRRIRDVGEKRKVGTDVTDFGFAALAPSLAAGWRRNSYGGLDNQEGRRESLVATIEADEDVDDDLEERIELARPMMPGGSRRTTDLDSRSLSL